MTVVPSLLGILVLASGLLTGSPALARGGNQDVGDARDESRIATTFDLSRVMRGQQIVVHSRSGRVKLTGRVDSRLHRDLAGRIALELEGVQGLDNQLVVDPHRARPAPSLRRDFAARVADATIAAAVTAKLAWGRQTNDLDAQVRAEHGRVILLGRAASAQTRDLAGRLAFATDGVVAVDNRLAIRRSTPGQSYIAAESQP